MISIGKKIQVAETTLLDPVRSRFESRIAFV